MILTDAEIRKEQEERRLISDFIDFEKQLQQSGFDLTVREVYSFETEGAVDFSNEERRLPECRNIEWDEKGWVHLKPGVYKVKTNEIVRMPKNLLGVCQTRTTLLRMGAFTSTGFWDPGFEGRSEFSLTVVNPNGIKLKKDARIVQIAFFRLSKEAEKEYNGIYKHLE